jgi:hypothetical protein
VSLPDLPWHPASEPAPPSKPDGAAFDVVFINRRATPVELCWVSSDGGLKSYGQIEANGRKRQSTRPGAVWLIRDGKQQPVGHFIIGDRASKATIPTP